MILLAIDTCEIRGAVAVRRSGATVSSRRHLGPVDYSEWLLPAVDQALEDAGVKMTQVDVLAVATGPGSFTGLRVGLATVKAWAEVYGMPVVGVSRLEALALPCREEGRFVAAFYDAQRGQVFGGLSKIESGQMARVGDEVVIAPDGFVELVSGNVGPAPVSWVSLDPELVTNLDAWKRREVAGDTMRGADPQLAASIAAIAEERAARGEFSDPVELDANYVRRSDAEIFWRGILSGVR